MAGQPWEKRLFGKIFFASFNHSEREMAKAKGKNPEMC